jgi:hypothetical protein
MIRTILLAAAALPIVTAAAGTARPATDYFGEGFPAFVPADVRLFVIDAQVCTHFGGELGDGDKDREAYIDKVMAKTCPNLDKRKARLERRYKHSARNKKVIAHPEEE